jgi:hypothetical protein
VLPSGVDGWIHHPRPVCRSAADSPIAPNDETETPTTALMERRLDHLQVELVNDGLVAVLFELQIS